MDKHVDLKRMHYISTQPSSIPGLKVAYGNQAAMAGNQFVDGNPSHNSLLGRIKEALINFVTEEAEEDRPIGISQLSRSTFAASEGASQKTFVKSQTARTFQDYRFNQLVETRRS